MTSGALCMKCRGRGARAHHRRCEKRGRGHRGRAEAIRARIKAADDAARDAIAARNDAHAALAKHRRSSAEKACLLVWDERIALFGAGRP